MAKTVLETFTIFPFSIVLALALGEAFKQYISEREGGNVQWKSTSALFTFLLLVLPFYQGMNRYLLQTYGNSGAESSAVFLIIDGLAFMAESAFFFAMSRNLPDTRWHYFYSIVLGLLVVDSLWGISAIMHAGEKAQPTIRNWIALNIVTSLVLMALRNGGTKLSAFRVSILGTVLMLIRTICDYWNSWNFYFS